MAKVPIKFGDLECWCAVDASDSNALKDKSIITAIVPVKGRSLNQNSLWAVWYNQVSKTLKEDTPEGVKRFCKLNYGVPILRAECSQFREFYDGSIKSNFNYEQKLSAMRFLPVTSLLSVDQGFRYTEVVQREYARRGVNLEIL